MQPKDNRRFHFTPENITLQLDKNQQQTVYGSLTSLNFRLFSSHAVDFDFYYNGRFQ